MSEVWDKIWMATAGVIATKSPDAETQVGAVIVDRDNHIKSIGFNGFMRGINDEVLPRTRPGKYPWMIHAEINAILACEHRPVGCILYCTCSPCLSCFQLIANSGIAEIVYPKTAICNMCDDEKTKEMLELAESLTDHYLKIRKI
jgi:dCMP deaminase